MSDNKTSFLGIPVEGYITRGGRSRTEKWPVEKLSPLLQAALSDPRVDSLRWRQYTPYFNDGDPCEFRLDEMTIKVVGTPDAIGDYEDGYVCSSDPAVVGGRRVKYERIDGAYQEVPYGDVLPALEQVAAIADLANNFNHLEDVLLDAFGDHAVVTVYRDRIEVEEYEHD